MYNIDVIFGVKGKTRYKWKVLAICRFCERYMQQFG